MYEWREWDEQAMRKGHDAEVKYATLDLMGENQAFISCEKTKA